MMRLLLVRHVETVGNVEHRFNGLTESDYTPLGLDMKEKLVEELAERLKDCHPVILTSPIRRAAMIAEELGEKLSLPVEENPALVEFNFGIFDGLTVKEAEEKDAKAYKDWIFNHLYVQIPEGDSYQGKYKQTKKFLQEFLRQACEQEREGEETTYVFIAHGAVLRCMLTVLLDLPLEAGWHIDIPLGGIADITYSGDYGILRRLDTPDYQGGKAAGYHKNFIR